MSRSYMKQKPICRDCNQEMVIDDIDYNFEGCQDEYWYCKKCGDALFIKIRYGKPCKSQYTEKAIADEYLDK